MVLLAVAPCYELTSRASCQHISSVMSASGNRRVLIFFIYSTQMVETAFGILLCLR